MAELGVLVVRDDVRGVAAGTEVARQLASECDRLEIVVRRGRSSLLEPKLVASGVGLPLLGSYADEPSVVLAAENGRSAGQIWTQRACTAVPGVAEQPDADTGGAGESVAERMTGMAASSLPGVLGVDATTLDVVRDRLVALGREYTPSDVAIAMRAEGLAVSDSTVLDAVESLRRHSVGAGVLEPLLRERGVTDVLVNGPDQVFVDRGSGLELTDLRFPHESDVRRLAQRLGCRRLGRRLDDAMPFVDARLPDGSRVHAVLGCLASPGTCISLRVPAQRSFSLQDCIASGSLTPGAAQLLSRMIEARTGVLISGGTGSGNPTYGLPHIKVSR
jgi:hypothetical protein